MKGHERKAEAFRRKVRELLALGLSVATIAKQTGKTYKHTKQIVEQEKQASGL